MSDRKQKERPSAEAPKPAKKRAYAKPQVETHPLFERMALSCDVKNVSPLDDNQS